MTPKTDLSDPILIDDFKHLGLTPEMIKALPEKFRQDLESGALTPLLKISRNFGDKTVEMPVKLQVHHDLDGKPGLLVFPVYLSLQNTLNLSEKAMKSLVKGDIVMDVDKDNNKIFMQIDPETNTIFRVKEKDLELEKKLADLEKVNDIELGVDQKQAARNGRPVELNVGGEQVVVGLDLRSPDSFRSLQGDMKEWQRQKEIEYDILHPEFVGLVQTDRNRWELQQIKIEGMNSKTLKQAPAQTKSASMKL